ncbi:hypothetical protein ES703_110761 [subsurface metagenome]
MKERIGKLHPGCQRDSAEHSAILVNSSPSNHFPSAQFHLYAGLLGEKSLTFYNELNLWLELVLFLSLDAASFPCQICFGL